MAPLTVAQFQTICVVYGFCVKAAGDAGAALTVIAKLAEVVPLPQGLLPVTVRFPEVAVPEKLIVIEAVIPDIVAPVPE